jgi:hypothetical protein
MDFEAIILFIFGILNIDLIRTLLLGLGTLGSFILVIKGIIEYSSQNSQKRASFFFDLIKEFKDNNTFTLISDLCENQNSNFNTVTYKQKCEYLGFFEEIALMMNSKLIKKEVAHYMFGYYAINCWKNENFWEGLARDGIYWRVFRDFINQMQEEKNNFKYSRKLFRF